LNNTSTQGIEGGAATIRGSGTIEGEGIKRCERKGRKERQRIKVSKT
jgi:hypothetical protein